IEMTSTRKAGSAWLWVVLRIILNVAFLLSALLFVLVFFGTIDILWVGRGKLSILRLFGIPALYAILPVGILFLCRFAARKVALSGQPVTERHRFTKAFFAIIIATAAVFAGVTAAVSV